MKIYLENRSITTRTEHNKFYQIELKQNDVFCKWGSISGYRNVANQYTKSTRVMIFRFNDKQSAKEKVKEILARKKKRGYCIVVRNTSRVNSRPTNGIQRKFGIEIETNTNLSKRKLAKKLKTNGLKTRMGGYNVGDGKKWDLKSDESCGYEIASPIINGESGIFDLKLCIDKIKDSIDGHYPDSRCGIHITVSVQDFTKDQIANLIKNFARSEQHFFNLCNKSRQSNRYCVKYNLDKNRLERLIDCRTLSEVKRIIRPEKYRGMNIAKLPECIEFRMFQSELSPRKVGRWARVCLGFVENAKTKQYTHKRRLTKSEFNNLVRLP